MKNAIKSTNKYPAGWDKASVKRVLAHYENQNEDQAVREDEAAFGRPSRTVMKVPRRLVGAVRKLIASGS
jgi:hypothetical protein